VLKKSVAMGLWLFLVGTWPAQCADRQVEGAVFYKGGEPAAGAAVELEDRSTMQISSRLTNQEGRFTFYGLDPEKDYEVRATKNGYWSKSHVVSRFSSRSTEKLTLYLQTTRNAK
jgi:hypothetical protein